MTRRPALTIVNVWVTAMRGHQPLATNGHGRLEQVVVLREHVSFTERRAPTSARAARCKRYVFRFD